METDTTSIVTCRACGSWNVGFLCSIPNDHSKTALLHNYHCRDCGTVFVGNSITPDELGEAYGGLDYDRYYAEIAVENEAKMATAVRHLDGLVAKDAAIIDVGTGNGMFVRVLDENGYTDVSAHEIEGSDLTAIKDTARRIFQDFDYSSIPAERFDVVTLLDVVEHVPDPQVLFDACSRILRPGGLVYFHTPVVTRTDRVMHKLLGMPGAKKIGTKWQRGRTSIFHLQNYTPAALSLLLERSGFADPKIEVLNELSWPVRAYIDIYMVEKQGLPRGLAPIAATLAYPFLATKLFNANKAIVSARKAQTY
jgi:2-polyprenyl-3-methyl-5-hydroxy-6-metoxy-1,4-benzoquinol methylase